MTVKRLERRIRALYIEIKLLLLLPFEDQIKVRLSFFQLGKGKGPRRVKRNIPINLSLRNCNLRVKKVIR